MSEIILGISAYYHDSAAVLLVDGKIVAAAQEERFTRIKQDADFPHQAANFVLQSWGVDLQDVNQVIFYEKAFVKFERLLETYHAFAPKGLKSFALAMPIWIKEKLFMRSMLKKELEKLNGGEKAKPEILFSEHHLSHAASAFFPSPFEEAAILTIDGVGEWATTSLAYGQANKIKVLSEIHFPHSLGLLYTAFTAYCGFKVNSGEYKLMGLAPYGHPNSEETIRFYQIIKEHLIDIREDGSYLLNMDYFDFATGLQMYNAKWEDLFGIPPKSDETNINQSYNNLAYAIQQVTEEIVLALAQTLQKLSGSKNICLAGGVALNCVANGKLLKSGIFDEIWIQPASGDAGGALGAALTAWYIYGQKTRQVDVNDSMQGSYLGPEFNHQDIEKLTHKYNAPMHCYTDRQELYTQVASLLAEGKVIGWFQGRMEYGPRALGARSIIADPRKSDMQKKLNLQIKFREGFRPFAPSVREEDISEYFEIDRPSPYMLLVAPIQEKYKLSLPSNYDSMEMYERLYTLRSTLPAITHLDYSARIQSVSKITNPAYWELISSFKKLSSCGVIVNTSFNVRGEPIVCTPKDAYLCFMRTDMDCLVLEDCLFYKEEQGKLQEELQTFAKD